MPGAHPGTHFASVNMISCGGAEMHSKTPMPPAREDHVEGFIETLRSYGNNSLWENLSIDGDGEWIREAMVTGSLCIAHDGSYIANKATNLCSAGIIMYCRAARQWLKASVAERSVSASNYRGKLLGAVLSMLILKAASDNTTTIRTTLHCDNRGVISHSNSPLMALPDDQQQADLIWLIKHLVSISTCKPIWEWVEGHAVERKGRQNCTLPEKLNDQADKLAKEALLAALSGDHVITGAFPFEVVTINLAGNRVCSSVRLALESDWGYRASQELYNHTNITRPADFHLIWCDGLGAAMARYPKMYRVWLTKHVSEFCGNNVQLYYWSKGKVSPKCKSCGRDDEYNMHIC